MVCWGCGYDLSGNVHANELKHCPECGLRVDVMVRELDRRKELPAIASMGLALVVLVLGLYGLSLPGFRSAEGYAKVMAAVLAGAWLVRWAHRYFMVRRERQHSPEHTERWVEQYCKTKGWLGRWAMLLTLLFLQMALLTDLPLQVRWMASKPAFESLVVKLESTNRVQVMRAQRFDPVYRYSVTRLHYLDMDRVGLFDVSYYYYPDEDLFIFDLQGVLLAYVPDGSVVDLRIPTHVLGTPGYWAVSSYAEFDGPWYRLVW